MQPITAFIGHHVKANGEETPLRDPVDLNYADLEIIPPSEVANIHLWLTERVSGFSLEVIS